MEDEYEYLVADSAENCNKIIQWMFTCGTQVQSRLDEGYSHVNVSYLEIGRKYRRKKPQEYVFITDLDDAIRGVDANVVEYSFRWNGIFGGWVEIIKGSDVANLLKSGVIRLKPGHTLPPKKIEELVPRTPEDFWPLIGKWWYRSKGFQYRWLVTGHVAQQEEKEMAPLGTENWGPMMKTYTR